MNAPIIVSKKKIAKKIVSNKKVVYAGKCQFNEAIIDLALKHIAMNLKEETYSKSA